MGSARTQLLRHLTAIAVALSAAAAAAQAPAPGPVSLIADSIEVDAEARTVTASGAVEVFHAGRVLRATRIVYDEGRGEIRALGPLELIDEEGGVVLADEAALTPDLLEGLILNARLLVAGDLQLATAEARRTGGGRYSSLYRVVASTCEVCPDAPVPTWAIRAARVVRDEEALQLHFRNAMLEVFGLPVLWLPYLRIPDPTVDRATGFLVPEFRRSGIYGAGLKLPYYVVLGPSADATVTPFLTEKGGTLMEGEYRRRFAAGGFDLWGVITLEDALDDRAGRGALTARGDHALPLGFRAELDASVTSDDQFLEQYDYSSADQLTSTARILRSTSVDYAELGTVAFQSLRPDEESSTIPFVIPEMRYRRLWRELPVGGRLGVDLDVLGLVRQDGQDMLRIGGGGDWRRDWLLGPGVLASATAGALVDLYQVNDEPGVDQGSLERVAPLLAAELRWPLARSDAAGMQVIEPVAQLVWSDTWGGTPPNEDSQLPEFDETNLFAFNRFPGRDRIESGLRANLGIDYSRIDARGWDLALQFGRVFRFSDLDQFPAGTGLDGRVSDWVSGLELRFDMGLTALNRTRFDDGFAIQRNELAVAYQTERGALAATYVFLAADDTNPDLGPQPESNEVSIDARYRVLPNWRLSGAWRYDFAADQPIRAGGAITYGNECAEFDLSVSRRFTTSANVPPSTSVGFVVRLAGFGAAGTEDWPRRAC